MTVEELKPIEEWIIDNVNRIDYGRVDVAFKIHRGKVTIIDTGYKKSEKPQSLKSTKSTH